MSLRSNYFDVDKLLPSHDPTLTDSKEIIIKCNTCNTKNKVYQEKIHLNIKCGSCSNFINIKDFSIESTIENLSLIIRKCELFIENILNDNNVINFCKTFSKINLSDYDINYISEFISWIDEFGKDFISAKRILSGTYNLNIDLKKIKPFVLKYSIKNDDLVKAKKLESRLQALKSYEQEDGYPEYPEKLSEAALHINNLEDASSSYWKWHFSPKAMKARRFLSSINIPKYKYKIRKEFLEKTKEWHQHWNIRSLILNELKNYSEIGIPLNNLSSKLTIPELQYYLNLAKIYLEVMVAVNSMPKSHSDEIRIFAEDNLMKISSVIDLSLLSKYLISLKEYKQLLNFISSLRSSYIHFSSLFDSLLSPIENTVSNLRLDSNAVKTILWLKDLYPYFSVYKNLKKIEQTTLKTLPYTLESIRNAILKGTDVRALDSPELIIETYRLALFIKNDLLENPDDINEISSKIRKLKENVRELIIRALEISRKLALKEAELQSNTRFEINKLKKIFKRKRKTYSFVQLRQQINYLTF